MQPQTEAGLGVLLGQADGAKQDSQDRQPHIVRCSAGQRPGRGDQAARAPSCCVQLAQQSAKVLRDRWNEAPGLRSVRKARVLPQVAEHFEEVRLSASEEAADPGSSLAGLAEIIEERPNDLLNAVGVLAFADEREKLAAQLGLRPLISGIRDSRLALVH